MTATSDHGTGKSVRGAWIGDRILSTRPDSISSQRRHVHSVGNVVAHHVIMPGWFVHA
jgi:hypothetical protein